MSMRIAFPLDRQATPCCTGGYHTCNITSRAIKSNARPAMRILLSVVLLVACMSTGCGPRKLDRSKAQELITAQLKFARAVTNRVQVRQRFEMRGRNSEWVIELASKGLLKDTLVRAATWQVPYDRHFTELTPEGLKYKVGESSVRSHSDGLKTYAIMKMADQAFVSITGIHESPGGDSAQVEFTWKYLNVTPFGEVAPLLPTVSGRGRLDYNAGKIHTETVTFTKYDDGWRLPAGWSLPVQITGYE